MGKHSKANAARRVTVAALRTYAIRTAVSILSRAMACALARALARALAARALAARARDNSLKYCSTH